MEAGRGKILRALDGLDVRRLRPEEYERFGGEELFQNLNRPEDVG
jgi:hypothetical protein